MWYIIANPAAGNGAAGRKWPEIEQCLQKAGLSYTIRFTEKKGHATQLAENAILKGHRQLMGIGGDGTNHEIINGILRQQDVPSREVQYALLPVGTGNDWARTYAIPSDIPERLARLKNPETRLQDIGAVRYQDMDGNTAESFFVNVAGMAYDAYVVKRMDTEGKPNTRLSYLLSVARYLFEYTLTPARITWPDNQAAEDHFYTINIGICKYSGGGMQLVPHAIPNDGLLALTFARKLPKWEVLLQTTRFYNGSLLQHPKLTGVQTTAATITPLQQETPLLLEADGEFLGKCPAVFSILPDALQVVL